MRERFKNSNKNSKIKFCHQTISFANAYGGLIIVGITDKDPKKVIGVDNLEEKVKQLIKSNKKVY